MSPASDLAPSRRGALRTKALARRWWLVAVCGLLGTALGATATSAPRYTATASVLVTPLVGSAFSPDSQGQNLENLQTEAEVLRSSAVATLVADRLGTDAAPSELLDQLKVDNPPNTQVLQVEFTADSPEAAMDGANAFGEQYLAYREESAQDSATEQLDNVNRAIASSRTDLDHATADLAKADRGSLEAELAQSRMQSAVNTIAELEASVVELRTYQTDPGEVLNPAELPQGPAGVPAWAFVPAGLLLGLLAGVGLAAWRAATDRRLFADDDVRSLGLPTLPADDVQMAATMLSTCVRPAPRSLAVAAVSSRCPASDWGNALAAAMTLSGRVPTVVTEPCDKPDGLELVGTVGSVALVAVAGHTTRPELLRAAELAEHAGATVVGVFLTRQPERSRHRLGARLTRQSTAPAAREKGSAPEADHRYLVR